MKEWTKLNIILIFTVIYLTFFAAFSFAKKNYEFLYSVITIFALLLLILFTYKKIHFKKYILISLSIFGLMHILGEDVFLFGSRLYDFWIIPNIFRYDNLVHAFGSFIVTLIVYSLLHLHLDSRTNHKKFFLCLILVSITMGIGTFNELRELAGVLFFNSQERVGDYMNNALDLFFNFMGSVLACFFILKYRKKSTNPIV